MGETKNELTQANTKQETNNDNIITFIYLFFNIWSFFSAAEMLDNVDST